MRVTVTFDLPDSPDYTRDDVLDAVWARLDELYPSDDGMPAIPANLSVTVSA